MTKSTKTLARWIFGLVILEAVLGAILYLMGDATTGPKFVFLLLVLMVNFPGLAVAAKLGLLGHGWLGSGGDPVLGWAITFGFSVLFYSGCIWGVHRASTHRRNQPDPWKTVTRDPQGTGAGEDS